MPGKCRRLLHLAILAAALAALAALLLGFPPGRPPFLAWRCPFYAATGLQCAGCGATRALQALARGQLQAAWALNPLLVAALPLGAGWLARAGWRYLQSGRLPRRPGWRAIAAAAAVLALFCLWRNGPA